MVRKQHALQASVTLAKEMPGSIVSVPRNARSNPRPAVNLPHRWNPPQQQLPVINQLLPLIRLVPHAPDISHSASLMPQRHDRIQIPENAAAICSPSRWVKGHWVSFRPVLWG
jgi:hypothetical protein